MFTSHSNLHQMNLGDFSSDANRFRFPNTYHYSMPSTPHAPESPFSSTAAHGAGAQPPHRHRSLTLDEINDAYPAMKVLEKQDCAICFEAMRSECRELKCMHSFCVPCIDEWLQRRACCPLCMTDQ